MDKSTLSNYGWVVIVTLVLSVMLALATPFGGYVGRAVSNVIKYYKTVTGDTFSADYIEGQGNKWDDYLNDAVPPKEIEDNDHIYGIGKTKSEYVLAIFNEDYSQVNIVKNGSNSDGIMMDFKPLSDFQNKDTTYEEAFVAWKPYASPMQLNSTTLKTAIIEKGVTTLGASAFANCSKLQDIEFVDTINALGDKCFLSCINLTSVDISKNVTIISRDCFNACFKLNNVTMSENVTKIDDYAFYNCKSLSEFHFPTKLKEIGVSSFFNTDIKTITFPNGLTSIGYSAFMNNTELTTAIIPASTTSIGEGVFRRTQSLKTITVDSDNPSYTVVNGVLYNKDKTLLLAYPATKTDATYTLLPTTTRIGEGAFSIAHLDTTYLNNNLKEIGAGAYEFATIKTINFTPNVKTLGQSVFYRTHLLSTITVDSNNTYFKAINNALYSYDGKTFCCYPASDPRTTFTMESSVTNIMDSAITSTLYLNEITISPNVTKLPAYCFSGSYISTINLPLNLTSIGYWTFSDMSNLTSIVIPNSVTSINEETFVGSPLTTIKGTANSYAETYAKLYGYNFIKI